VSADSASQPLWLILLSSSALSAFVSAVIAGLINLRAKRNEYVNDFYKTVIKRRIAAYEQIENLIIWLKLAVCDADGRPYHILFSEDGGWEKAHALLVMISSQGLWLSDEAFQKGRELNILIFHLDKPSDVIRFAKENHQAIATIRAELERVLAKDMLTLHDVERFLKSKNKADTGFRTVYLKR
jgi:hypothetical protein